MFRNKILKVRKQKQINRLRKNALEIINWAYDNKGGLKEVSKYENGTIIFKMHNILVTLVNNSKLQLKVFPSGVILYDSQTTINTEIKESFMKLYTSL
jgi:hypothetical protein